MVRAPRWASMRLKRPSPAPISRTIRSRTSPHSSSITESRSKVRLGSPSSTKRMYSEAKACQPLGSFSSGIRIWSVKRAAIMHE